MVSDIIVAPTGPATPAVASDDAEVERWSRLDLLVVVVLVVAGALLRLPQLGPSSLWLDDAWLALATKADGLGELARVGFTSPGFSVALAALVGVSGFSSTAAQALPFAMGVVGPPALYLVSRYFGLIRGAAAVGAALVLSAPIHVVYSARVKPFTTEAVLAVVVLGLGWWVATRPAEARRWLVLGLVAAGATMVSAAVAATVVAAYGAGLAALVWRSARPRRWAPALASMAGYGVFALGWWMAVVRPASTPSLRAYWADHYVDLGSGLGPAAADLVTRLWALLGGLSALPVGVVAVVLVVSAVAVAWRRPVLAVLLVTPLVVSVALAALNLAPLGGGRTDTHLYPSLALLVALALHLALRRLPGPAWWAVPVAVVALVALPVRAPPPYPEQDLRPLVALMEDRAEGDDAIVVYSASRWAYALYTTAPVDLRADPGSGNGFAVTVDDPRLTVLGPHRTQPERYEPEIDAAAAGHDRLWLLSSHTRADFDVLGPLLAERGFAARTTEARPGAQLTLWVR